LRSSSICRRHARPVLKVALAALAAAWATTPLAAIDPERLMDQYIHDRWESDRGFPGGSVHAITQSRDGYLWIAADKGLVRFDGLVFQLFQRPGLTIGQDQTVLAIAPDPSGGLWAQLRNAMLARFHQGRFQDPLPSALNEIGPAVTAMSPTATGAILLSVLYHGVIRYQDGQAQTIVSQRLMPSSFVIAIAQTADGDIWLGTRDSGLLRLHGGHLTIVRGLPDQKINALVAGERNELWIGTDDGVSRWNGVEVTHEGVPESLAHVGALAMIRDQDGNLWIGTTSGELLRVNRYGVASLDERDRARRGAVTTVFEDRDGNVWMGTNRGIERLRDGVFATFSTAQGLPAGTYGPVFVDGDRTWIAPLAGGLYSIAGGQRIEPVSVAGLANDVVYSISGGGGDVWLARQRGGLTQLVQTSGGAVTARTFRKADGLAQDNVYAVHRARDGAVWAGTLSAGLSRLKDGRFTTFTTEDGLASNTVNAIAEAGDGGVWLATPNGVNHQQGTGWRKLATSDGLPSNDVNTLFEDSARNMWIGTAAGLALARGGRVLAGFQPPDHLRSSIVGIAEDRSGGLWIATNERILSVSRERLAANTATDADLREFGASDGLLGVEGVKRHRSLTTDAGGRVWLSTTRGLSMTNPGAEAAGRAAPALVSVETVTADGTVIEGVPLSIPPRRQRIAFNYTGLSLATPERVQFRYRLEGFDRDWSAPSTTRQAVYTNLGPGEYRFRLLASNGDGQWNGDEAVVAFMIAPAFWQTAWFQLSLLLLVSAAAWGAYRLRLLQVRHQLNVRFEERLAERTRIAQELHDTLLQGFLSASMQLHVAADRVAGDSPAKASLAKVLDLMGRVIEEGRNAVRGLRSPGAVPDDLHRAFSGMSDELNVGRNIEYRVVVEGRDRPLQPFIRDEIYRIGREAVVNAFRHSEASRVELALEYGSRGLRVLVRDNGRGIDTQVLNSGSEGHWGLAGMRERADRIGAAFRVLSSAEAGTEVELTVPARVAFAPEKKRDRTA
jgi:ligand-binding sensor domain-containing protein/signal transduction histidine kinase